MGQMGQRLRALWESEKEKMRPMSVKERTEYIWQYYWLWIIGFFAFWILAVYIIYHAFFTVKENWFYAIYANTMEDGGMHSPLWEDFVSYTGYDLSQKNVVFNSASFFDPSRTQGTNNSYFQSFVAVVEAGDLDIVTMGTEGLEALGTSGRLADLQNDSLASIQEKYQDRFITCLPYDETYSTQPVPIGIDVSDSLLVTKYHLYEGDCALGISAYSQHLEGVEAFLAFIFEEG